MMKLYKKGENMNINYFDSILDLYLNKEEKSKTFLNFIKCPNNKVKVNIGMNNSKEDITSFYMDYDIIFEKNTIKGIIHKIKSDLIIIDEKYEFDKLSETCYYLVLLRNGRKISFNGFSLIEINSIRNYIYNIDYKPEEIKVIYEEEKKGYYNNYRLSMVGASSYMAFAVLILVFFLVFGISLILFKIFL